MRHCGIQGSSDRSDGPVLTDDYTDAAKAAAEKRMVLAGYRLADTLATAFGGDRP